MNNITIIIASTRPGRQGPAIAKWIGDFAAEHGKFDVVTADLAEFNLPLFNEVAHPRMQKYEHDHTKAWSATVDAADAFVIVTPEYNFGAPPALVNALDYLYVEWNYKPMGFVSYGGISGGLRSVQMIKQIVTAQKVMPIPEAVTIPFFGQQIADGVFTPNDGNAKSASGMLDELARWADALRPMRGK